VNDLANELKWNLVAYAIVAGASLVTLIGLYFFLPELRKRWLPVPRMRPGTWTGYEVFLAICIFAGFPLLILTLLFDAGFFVPLLGPEPDSTTSKQDYTLYLVRCSYISSPLMLAVTLAALLAVMFARTRSRPHHYGLSWSRWPANLALGITAFTVARPVIIAIYALALLVLPKQTNPIELLTEKTLPMWEWFLFGFQTTIMAPLLEEIIFRGILQGWLRRATLVGHAGLLALILWHVAQHLVLYDTETKTISYNWDMTVPLVITVLAAAGYVAVMFRLARTFHLSEAEIYRWQPRPGELPRALPGLSEDQAAERRRQLRSADEQRMRHWTVDNAALAILGSALLFAATHPWPAPIALFPMALLLGWLYQRTQSLVGPITFHALFNLTTFIALYGSVLYPPEQNGNEQTTAVPPAVAGSTASCVPGSQEPLRK
jgi:membrane protease YdiL (CAAX protease family)